MTRLLAVGTPAELEAVIEAVRAVGDAVKRLTLINGGVSSGELYAHLMAVGVTLDQYGAIIETLEDAGIIEVNNFWVTWKGGNA